MNKHIGWTIHYPKCIGCGTTNNKHAGKGLCSVCYDTTRKKYIPHLSETKIQLQIEALDRLQEIQAITPHINRIKSLPLKTKRQLYYLVNKKRINDRNNIKRQTNQKNVVEYLLLHPCVDCGEKNPVVLHFDHIADDKDFSISERLKTSWDILLKEIGKCKVRCANCHAKRTAKQQNWWKLQFLEKKFNSL